MTESSGWNQATITTKRNKVIVENGITELISDYRWENDAQVKTFWFAVKIAAYGQIVQDVMKCEESGQKEMFAAILVTIAALSLFKLFLLP